MILIKILSKMGGVKELVIKAATVVKEDNIVI